MSIVYETRSSDSPYIETVTRGRTVSAATSIRPAESHWHMVFVRQHGDARPLLVGPWSGSGAVSWTEDAEILWIRFELGTFMPRLPVGRFLDTETVSQIEFEAELSGFAEILRTVRSAVRRETAPQSSPMAYDH